jgi:hypothetical protein
MEKEHRPVVMLLHAGKRAETLLEWLRQLVPAAVLLVTPPSLTAVPSEPDALVIDAQDVDSPLSLADAVTRAKERVVQQREASTGQS